MAYNAATVYKLDLNARNTINTKKELNIMVEDTDPHIIGITNSWANTGISYPELRLTGYIMFTTRHGFLNATSCLTQLLYFLEETRGGLGFLGGNLVKYCKRHRADCVSDIPDSNSA